MAVKAPSWILRSAGLVALAAGLVMVALVAVGLARIVLLVERLVRSMPGAARIVPRLGALGDFARGEDRPGRSATVLVAAIISAACWMLDATIFWLVAAASTAGALGVAPAPALALAILAHAVAVLPTAAGGAVCLIIMDKGLGRLAQEAAATDRPDLHAAMP